MRSRFAILVCLGLVFAAGCGKDEPHMPNGGKGFFGPQKMQRPGAMKNAAEAGRPFGPGGVNAGKPATGNP